MYVFSLLRRGSMFILSEEQFKWLLSFGGFNISRLSAKDNEISMLGDFLVVEMQQNVSTNLNLNLNHHTYIHRHWCW